MATLLNELEPINDFTVKCEADNFTQGNAYIEYRALENKLEVINTLRSKQLLRLIHNCFKSTADIEIARLCYYTTNQGIQEKQQRYQHIELTNLDPDDNESNEKYDKELEFIISFREKIRKLCKKLNLDSDIVFNAFKLLMYYYFLPNNSIRAYPGPIEIYQVLIKYAPQKIYYISVSKFIEALQVLPASEAAAERIFA